VVAGTTYYYRVNAVNAGGQSGYSNEVHLLLTPASPTITSVTAAAGGVAPVTVTWSSVANATSYVVYRSTSSGAETLVGTETSPYVDGTASAAGASYFYKVAAVNSGGTSPLSAEGSATLTPSVVSSLVITSSAGATPVTLAWTSSPGTTGFQVYRGTSASPLTLLDTGSGSTYSDAAAAAGGTYYYTVTQVNAGGTSAQSNEVGPATVTPSTPGTPSVNTVIALDNAAAITWSASAGATGYNVYRSTTSGGEVLYDTTSTTSYTDTAATQTTYGAINYYYTVTAVDAGGESAQSGESTPANPCDTSITTDQPTGLAGVADATPGILDLTWTSGSSDDLLGYQTYASDVSNPGSDPFPNDFGNSGALSSTAPTSAESAQDNFGTTTGSPGPLVSGTPYYFDVTEGDQCGVYSTLSNGTAGPVAPN